MHHGYYVPEDRTDHVQAQIDLIDEVLKWAGAENATSVVDVGCGIGGSSRHIAKKFNCKAQGITLSPYQANRGNELAAEQGLSGQTSFQVRLPTRFISASRRLFGIRIELESSPQVLTRFRSFSQPWFCIGVGGGVELVPSNSCPDGIFLLSFSSFVVHRWPMPWRCPSRTVPSIWCGAWSLASTCPRSLSS